MMRMTRFLAVVLLLISLSGINCALPGVGKKKEARLNRELLIAVRKGDTVKVKEALKRGADINARYEDGMTPLHWAALMGRAEVCELLIREGADINVTEGKTGLTPLGLARTENNATVEELLLEHGAKPYGR